MGHPVLDIGMPVWNRAQYIERSIRSILNQDFSYFRLIISDNGSTDGTSEICERLALQDRRIKYVRHKTNRGLVENFQAVIDLCEAEFFMLATSDDLWSENWVSDLLTIARNEDAAACGRTSYIDGDDQKRSGVQRRWQTSINNSLIRRAHYLWSLTPAPIFGIYSIVVSSRHGRRFEFPNPPHTRPCRLERVHTPTAHLFRKCSNGAFCTSKQHISQRRNDRVYRSAQRGAPATRRRLSVPRRPFRGR